MTSSHPFLEWIFMRRIPWSGLQIWCAGVKNGGLCWDVGWKMSNEHGCVIFGWPSMKGSLHSLWLGYFQQSPSNFPDLHRWMWSQQDPFSECKPWAKCEEVSEISMGKTAFSCLWKGGMRVISPLLCFHDSMSHMARGVSPHLAEWGSYVGICEINASKERCLIYRLKIWLHYEDSKDWNWTWACSRLWSSMSPERLTRFGLHPSDCVANQYGRIERSPPGGRWFDPRCTYRYYFRLGSMCQQHLKLWVICFYQAEPSWKLESCCMRSKCQESVQKQKHKHLPARMMIHWTFASLSQWPTIKTLGVYISSRKKSCFNFYYMVLKLNELPSQVFLRSTKKGVKNWSPWESIPRTPMTLAPRKWLCCLMPQGVPLLSLGAWPFYRCDAHGW